MIRQTWVTKGLMMSSRMEDNLFRKCIYTPRTSYLYLQCIKFRNIYNKLKRISKTKYNTDLFERYKHDIRKTWLILNSLVIHTSNKSTLSDTFRMGNPEFTNPKTIADELCNYFTGVGSKLAK